MKGFSDLSKGSTWRKSLFLFVPFARNKTSQQLKSFFDACHRPNVEFTSFNSLANLSLKHQMLHILNRYYNSLPLVEALDLADPEKAFNFFIDTAYRLNFPKLVHRACDCNTLVDGQISKCAEDQNHFRQRCRVSIYAAVVLFKTDCRRKNYRIFASKNRIDPACQN